MSDSSMTMTATTDQWMQFYQQPLMEGHSHHHDHDHSLAPHTEGFFSDATVMTTSPTPTMPSSSESNSILSQLTPKSGIVSKPIRRRSRASKRTPTTLLNANTANFRALVQQFTGCPSTTMSTLGVHKGPITLNFQQGTSAHKSHHHNTSRVVLPFSSRSYNNNNNNQVHQVPSLLPNWQKQEEPQLHQQQSEYSFGFVKNNDFLPSSGNSIRPSTSMDVSDGLLLDNDFSLSDLTVNGFPNENLLQE